jgi:hypothetical protein
MNPTSQYGRSPTERQARLVGGPADGHRQTVGAEPNGSWPERIRSEPEGDPDEERSMVYRLRPSPTAEGDLVYEVEPAEAQE